MSYNSYQAGKSAREAEQRRKKEIKVVYEKEGKRLSLKCRREQVERLTQRMNAAGVIVLSIGGHKHPNPYLPGISQVAYFDNSWLVPPLWECEVI